MGRIQCIVDRCGCCAFVVRGSMDAVRILRSKFGSVPLKVSCGGLPGFIPTEVIYLFHDPEDEAVTKETEP